MTTYVQNTWVDQDVERPRTYEVNTNQDGSITLIDSFGDVTELGTPVNATNMNHIESGIAKLYEGAVLYDEAQTFTDKSIVFFIDENDNVKIYRSLVNPNIGNPLTSAEYWKEIKLGGGSAGGVGSVQWSLLPQTDAGLHLMDGALIQGNGIYREFVQYIADLYTDNPTANYFTTEANWQTSVSTYGVCGKFVYDSVNNTVRLPKVTGIIEGTIDATALGDLVQAGLPNITGALGDIVSGDGSNRATGAFYVGGNAQLNKSSTATANITGFGFDASRSSSIYGNSSTVQPQSIKGFLYIVIANSTKTNIEVDIDEIATDLNGKADVDLTNTTAKLSDSFLSKLTPDYANAIDLGLTATWKSYTCPSNGYVDFLIVGFTGGDSGLKINNKDILITRSGAINYIQDATGQFMVSKGDIVSFRGTYTVNDYGIQYIEFIPMKGAN